MSETKLGNAAEKRLREAFALVPYARLLGMEMVSLASGADGKLTATALSSCTKF